MMASSGFDTWTYRHGFDLAIPFYMAGLSDAVIDIATTTEQRPYLLIAAQLNMYARHNRIMQELAYDHQDTVLVLQECHAGRISNAGGAEQTPKSKGNGNRAAEHLQQRSGETDESIKTTQQKQQQQNRDWRCAFPTQEQHEYPTVLAKGRFCLVARGMRLLPLNLLESMAAGCVPVFMADNLVLPFEEVCVEIGICCSIH